MIKSFSDLSRESNKYLNKKEDKVIYYFHSALQIDHDLLNNKDYLMQSWCCLLQPETNRKYEMAELKELENFEKWDIMNNR